MRLLVVEDDPDLNRQLTTALADAGYAVDRAFDGEEGHYLGDSEPYDAVILDIGLPKMDGISVLEAWRRGGRTMPVLILTARDEKESVVTLLNAGADDYVCKPFDLGELMARSKALIRRGKGQSAAVLKVGNIRISTADLTVRQDGKLIPLTAMEYRVLEYLAHRPGAVVSKSELSEHLYDFNWERFSNVIEVYISGLRRKLEDRKGETIQTLRGQGYLLHE